jgi:hypothetical protein
LRAHCAGLASEFFTWRAPQRESVITPLKLEPVISSEGPGTTGGEACATNSGFWWLASATEAPATIIAKASAAAKAKSTNVPIIEIQDLEIQDLEINELEVNDFEINDLRVTYPPAG